MSYCTSSFQAEDGFVFTCDLLPDHPGLHRAAEFDVSRDCFREAEWGTRDQQLPMCPNKAERLDGPGGGDPFCHCALAKHHAGPCVCEHGFSMPLRWNMIAAQAAEARR